VAPKQAQPEDLTKSPPNSKENERDSDNPRTGEVTKLSKAKLTNVRLEVEGVGDAKETEKNKQSD